MIQYTFVDGSTLTITDAVENHLLRHRQVKWLSREAGGQLFASISGSDVLIEEATGPRKTDRRGRWHYLPDRKLENAEIIERYERGLHFVGDWHTHPQDIPSPSTRDIDSIRDCVKRSEHSLNGFILIVVGRLNPPSGMYVSFHDGSKLCVLRPQLFSKPSAD